jgi:hypothetical protein
VADLDQLRLWHWRRMVLSRSPARTRTCEPLLSIQYSQLVKSRNGKAFAWQERSGCRRVIKVVKS